MKHKLKKISFPWGSLREKIKHRFSFTYVCRSGSIITLREKREKEREEERE
jgi:hypothetical protein